MILVKAWYSPSLSTISRHSWTSRTVSSPRSCGVLCCPARNLANRWTYRHSVWDVECEAHRAGVHRPANTAASERRILTETGSDAKSYSRTWP